MTTSLLRSIPHLALLCLALSACGPTPVTGAPDGGTDAPAVTVDSSVDSAVGGADSGGPDGGNPDGGGNDGGGDLAMPPRATFAAVTTSSFMTSGSLNTIRLSDDSPTKAIDTSLDQDNGVRAAAGKLYIVDRTHGTVAIDDPAAGFKNPVLINTGDANVPHAHSNPHDTLAIPGSTKIYVALYGNDAAHAIGVLDSATPTKGVVKWIAVPKAMSPNASANDLYLCGSLVYATLDDLDNNFTPSGPGRIAIIDSATDAVVGTNPIITLAGTNPGGGAPGGIAAVDPTACGLVLVAHSGDYNKPIPNGGGLELVDLQQRKSLGFILTDSDFKASPGTLTSAGKNLVYTVVSNPDFTGSVIAVDPTQKKILGSVLGPADFITFAAASPDGQLFVGVAKSGKGHPAVGVYVGPAVFGKPLGISPIDLGQAPYAIAFY